MARKKLTPEEKAARRASRTPSQQAAIDARMAKIRPKKPGTAVARSAGPEKKSKTKTVAIKKDTPCVASDKLAPIRAMPAILPKDVVKKLVLAQKQAANMAVTLIKRAQKSKNHYSRGLILNTLQGVLTNKTWLENAVNEQYTLRRQIAYHPAPASYTQQEVWKLLNIVKHRKKEDKQVMKMLGGADLFNERLRDIREEAIPRMSDEQVTNWIRDREAIAEQRLQLEEAAEQWYDGENPIVFTSPTVSTEPKKTRGRKPKQSYVM